MVHQLVAEVLLLRDGRTLRLAMLGASSRTPCRSDDEHGLLAPFAEDFVGYEEPHDVREVLEPGWPYLPADGALGEMVLASARAIYLHGKGADGIIDISPFSCMNGIVSEAVYPAVARTTTTSRSANFYFDASRATWSATWISSWSWRAATAPQAQDAALPGLLRRLRATPDRGRAPRLSLAVEPEQGGEGPYFYRDASTGGAPRSGRCS